MTDTFHDLLFKSSLPSGLEIHERNVINFFICSAFEDFEIERKILNTRVFPQLRQQCFDQFGVEIKLVDIKLGLDSTVEVTKSYQDVYYDNLNKHGICDIYNCPIFFFGQKYGRISIPNRLPLEIYDLFRTTMKRYRKRFPVEHDFLNTYYMIDSSSIEPEMILVDAYELFPDLNSNDTNAISQSQEEWYKIKNVLSDVFQRLSNICLFNHTLDISKAREIFVYEMETSVSMTLNRSLNSAFPPIIFNREIIDIKNFIVLSNINKDSKRKESIEKLIDVYYNDENELIINEDLQVLLRQCYNSCFEIFDLTEPTFKILWKDDGGVCEEQHKEYLEQAVAYFTNKILEAVNQRIEKMNFNLSPNLLKCYDLISNATIQTNKFFKLSCGYEDICSALLDYVTDENENIPIILYGPANSGKSIVLARTIYELQNLHQSTSSVHIITRFINSGYTLNEILSSIFVQMSAIVFKDFQFEAIKENSSDIESNIAKDLESIFFNFQPHSSIEFVVILHDLEKCLGSNPQINFTDLIPKLLPKNIKLIVASTEGLDSRKPYFLNIPLSEFTATEFNIFVQTQLNSHGKYLTEEHNENLLLNYLKFTEDIFTANVIVNHLIKLPRFDQERICNNINEFYIAIINDWFKRFGEKVISHILLFLFCSHGGLTDSEIVEILTLDEEVMHESFKRHKKSIILDQDTVRFSSALWLIIKQELSSVLIEKIKDGYLLVDLGTEFLIEVLMSIQKETDLQYFHKILSEYFLGVWSMTKKPFAFYPSQTEKFYFCCPRDQKMFSKYERNIFYNYRKFRQLARHLSNSNMNEELLKEVIFNFDWLYNKTKALKVNELLQDFQFSRNDGKEILLLEESFQNSASIIENDLDSLAGELIIQLLPYVPYYPNLRLLIETCDRVAPMHNAFIPIYPTNKLPGSSLVSSINCPGAIESVIVTKAPSGTSNELLIKLKDDSKAFFYDLSFGDIVYNTLLSTGKVFLRPGSDIILVLETNYKQTIKVHQKSSGELLGQIIPMNWIVLRPFEERNNYQISNIDIGETKVALIVTNEVSYLFVLSLETLEPLLAFNPGVRLEMLKLSPDESTVFTHHKERLVSLNVEKNQLNSAVELQGIPFLMLFSKEQFRKAFIVCKNQKSVIVLDLETLGVVKKCYKISFENCLDENDYVLEVSCSEIGNTYLLIRSCHSVILYDWVKEKVLSHIARPSQLPIYFKLPNQYDNQPTSLQFNSAKLILSDKIIVCALFRDIIICTVADNQVLKTLHAPVGGIVSEIHIVDQYLIGKVDMNEETSEVMIWNSDPSYLLSKIESNQDRLTKSISNLQIGESVAIATCENSDEMGVIEISTGTLVDLYSHSSVVMMSCLSCCGKWAFVVVNNDHNANILWSLEARKIVFEFGKSSNVAYVIQMKSISGFLCITNHSMSLNEPNFTITQIVCESEIENNMKDLELNNEGFICEEPCLLNEDKVIIFLADQYKIESRAITSSRVLAIWSRDGLSNTKGASQYITKEQLSDQINKTIESILSIRSLSSKEDFIYLLCESLDHSVDILLFNYQSKVVMQFLDLFQILPPQLDINKLFTSKTGCYIFDEKSCSIVNIFTGEFVGRISSDKNCAYTFGCFALKDTILVLSQKTKLFAWRLPEICKIGQIELKEEITFIAKCLDDYTLIIGCIDGSFLSYSLVDVFSPFSYLSEIKVVRNYQVQSRSPTIQFEMAKSIQKTSLSQEFDSLVNVKRPLSEPIVAHERREFSNIF